MRSLFRSQKSMPPLMLPKPPRHKNRPCGLQNTELRWATPNSNTGSPSAFSIWCTQTRNDHIDQPRDKLKTNDQFFQTSKQLFRPTRASTKRSRETGRADQHELSVPRRLGDFCHRSQPHHDRLVLQHNTRTSNEQDTCNAKR